MAAPSGTTTFLVVVKPSCPAGTPQASPTSTDTGLPDCVLWQMEVVIPAGHQGYTGLQLYSSGAPIVPGAASSYPWFTGDDEHPTYPYSWEVQAGSVLRTFNTGTYDHTWQVRLLYTPVAAKGSGAAIVTPTLSAAELHRITG